MEITCRHCGKVVSFSGYKPSKCQFCGKSLTEEEVSHSRSSHSSYTVPSVDVSSLFSHSSDSSSSHDSFSDVSGGSSSSSDFSGGGGDSGGGGSSDSF